MQRFEELEKLVDIGQTIAYYEEVVRLIPDGNENRPEQLYWLGTLHYYRFKSEGKVPDIDKAIDYQGQVVQHGIGDEAR